MPWDRKENKSLPELVLTHLPKIICVTSAVDLNAMTNEVLVLNRFVYATFITLYGQGRECGKTSLIKEV